MDKKTTSNFIYNLVYQILSIITPLATSPYIARVLGSTGVGIYSYTSTIALTFALFAALGTVTYGQREIAIYQSDLQKRSQIFWEIFLLRGGVTLLVVAAYFGFCFLYQDYTVHLLQCSFIVIAIIFDISWLYMGMENFKIIVSNNILVKLVTIICVFLFVRRPEDVGIYILINSLSSIITTCYFMYFLPKYVKRVPLKELRIWRHLPGILKFFIPIIAVQIYSQIDKLMLGAMGANISENGYYEQARKLTNLVVVMTTALNTVLLPRLSHLYGKEDRTAMVETYRETFRFTLLLLIPIAVGLFMISDTFILWFLGPDFVKTSLLLKWSCALVVFMTIGNFVGMQYLAPTGQQGKMSMAYLTAAGVNVILNLLMIPQLLSEGAIIASVAAEAVSCGMQIWLLKRSEYNFKMLQGVWKYVIAAAAMAGGIWLLNTFVALPMMAETFADIALGGVIYFVALLVLQEESLKRASQKLLSKMKK